METLKLIEIRPGMENKDFKVKIIKINKIRKVKSYSGIEHQIIEGKISDESSNAVLTVWNEKITDLSKIKAGDIIELKNCFITSFKGILQVNVGRDSTIRKN